MKKKLSNGKVEWHEISQKIKSSCYIESILPLLNFNRKKNPEKFRAKNSIFDLNNEEGRRKKGNKHKC